jgi:hypothetical protein
MVSSLLVDALNDPTRALVDLYNPSEDIDNFPKAVSNYFSKIFESADAFKEVRISPTLFIFSQTYHLRADTDTGSATSARVPCPQSSCTFSRNGTRYFTFARDVSLEAEGQQMWRMGNNRPSYW